METQNLQLEKSILSKKGNSGKVVVPAFKLNDTAIMSAWCGPRSRPTDQWSGIKSATTDI